VIQIWPTHEIPRFTQGRRNQSAAAPPADKRPVWRVRISRKLCRIRSKRADRRSNTTAEKSIHQATSCLAIHLGLVGHNDFGNRSRAGKPESLITDGVGTIRSGGGQDRSQRSCQVCLGPVDRWFTKGRLVSEYDCHESFGCDHEGSV